MKKITKLLSLLTAASLICSAGALSACGSDDEAEENVVSDEVTAEEWEAAFADENFYNVTINLDYSSVVDRSSTCYDDNNNLSYYYRDYQSGDYDGIYGYDLTSSGEILSGDIEILSGNIYDYESGKGEYQYKYESAEYPEYNEDTDETTEYVYYSYSVYDEQGYDSAGKFVYDGEEGEWSYYSGSYLLYADGILYYTGDYSLSWFIQIAQYRNFEYKDGAYVYSYTHDESDYVDMEILEFGLEYEVTEFTGGTETYSVIIKDGKVYSLKYTYSYTLGLNYDYSRSDYSYAYESYESYSIIREWTFSDYGTTTVTVPDEVTALFE